MEALKAVPVLALLALGVWLAASVPSSGRRPGDDLPVNHTDATGIRQHDSPPIRSIRVQDREGNALVLDHSRAGVRVREGSATAAFVVTRTEYAPAIDVAHDLGVWVGLRRRGGDVPFDTGVVYSPVRLAWGAVAPAVVVSPRTVGIGVVGHLPDTVRAGAWNDLGVGVVWAADRDGGSGLVPGVSFSARF